MNELDSNSPAPAEPSRSIRTLVGRMRDILGRTDLESENHRKAALRSLLHEHAAGLTREEIEDLVGNLRDRFPDRIFESVNSAQGLASRSAELEKSVKRLREERDRLRQQVDSLGSLIARLAQAAGTPAGQDLGAEIDIPQQPALTLEAQTALLEIAGLLFPFALNQEVTARSVEEILAGDSADTTSRDLTSLLPRLAAGETLAPEELEAIHDRLRWLQLLPGALLTGAQQSWNGGTVAILDHLEPKAVTKSIKGVLKYPAILKEVEQRFEQFRKQFDSNIEHYYRERFERAYRNKMEGVK